MSLNYKTEDEVRNSAGAILGFDKLEKDITQGTGQITTFQQLGFPGETRKPDGWYLPKDLALPAIILETKSGNEDIKLPKWEKELFDNVDIALKRYKYVIGILYNGKEVRIYNNKVELAGVSKVLEDKSYYLSLVNQRKIDKNKIFRVTKKINDCLHIDFGIKDTKHRMIFTACALVAKRYGAVLTKGMDYVTFHTSIHSALSKSLQASKRLNQKLDILLEVYSDIKMNSTENQDAIDNFIEWVSEISDCITSDNWNGEDVMGIFFNEFNRYRKKSERGQVFTPDHLTSFMYRLLDINSNDVVLDAACGSGAFLVKCMCNMIDEVGGANTRKASNIKSAQLFGIEFDREIFALACANMLIHKDGKTNLEQLDSREQQACDWIKSKPITKVLMNPPFERKYGCKKIVQNVLDNVPLDTKCAFILPDKKLEKDNCHKFLEKHRLEKIIKLPEATFQGTTTSIFIFTAGRPQNGQEIFACYIQDDGLQTVKNQGRQDIYNRWPDIENKWIEIIHKQSGDNSIQWLKPDEHLSYQIPEAPFTVEEEDFFKTILDYEFYNEGIDVIELKDNISRSIMYEGIDADSINRE